MSVCDAETIGSILKKDSYQGRGIVVGKTADEKCACVAYFIMGRSANSRNRVFVAEGDNVTIYPHDEKLVEDPSLIIYSPLKVFEKKLIVTNGDQTDTIYNFLKSGKSFEDALLTRTFEPDEPNFTPRISAMLNFFENDFSYTMSILKSACACESASKNESACECEKKCGDEKNCECEKSCERFYFNYPAKKGCAHFIHTYSGVKDGVLQSFVGEPKKLRIDSNIDEWTSEIWESLDSENRISLYVRFINLQNLSYEFRLINKNVSE
ncbi:MAG: IMP cyclohydrolase [Treponema sp.]|nr:IMP cyclohydrolase [Treponema sp.]